VNAADLARLEVAKRAYNAAQPSATEVQTGVRRARLSLRRGKSRRNWFGKGLVLVVLAIGSLAYAKPHALGELVENLTRPAGAGGKRGGRASAAPTPLPSPVANARGTSAPSAGTSTEVAVSQTLPATPEATPETAKLAAAALPKQPHRGTSAGAPSHRPATVAATSTNRGPAESTEPAAVSDWGRVGQALARGDETQALAALGELSESGDQRTRDKADLGRAQLFMAHGDRDKGCLLARSLSNRRAGSHIERQAQLLLKSCTR
jgi:hypothetical protein